MPSSGAFRHHASAQVDKNSVFNRDVTNFEVCLPSVYPGLDRVLLAYAPDYPSMPLQQQMLVKDFQ